MKKRVIYKIKKLLSKLKLIFIFRRLKRIFLYMVGLRIAAQNLKANKKLNLVKLGSDNCGWTFVDDPALEGSVIVSAGLGEDASFDIEIASKYNLTVHIIDPTPKAILHYDQIMKRLGKPKTENYVQSGTQPESAYDLKNISCEQLNLHKVALWNENSKVKFYAPLDENHVSHSIINLNSNPVESDPYIEVDAIKILDLMRDYAINPSDVMLLKLDIEGAEIEVIDSLIKSKFRPRQILVEFDELNSPTKARILRVEKAYEQLIEMGYKQAFTDGQADFLFVLE